MVTNTVGWVALHIQKPSGPEGGQEGTMEDRMVVAGEDAGGPIPVLDMDENEDEKVYYGFGVFMGLPLADLKAMKEELLQQQRAAGALTVGHGNNDARMHDNGHGAARSHGGYADQRHDAYAQHADHTAAAAHSGAPHGSRVRPIENGTRAGGLSRHGSSSSTDSVRNENGAGDGEQSDTQSEDGSEGQYPPKSHSLNFILG